MKIMFNKQKELQAEIDLLNQQLRDSKRKIQELETVIEKETILKDIWEKEKLQLVNMKIQELEVEAEKNKTELINGSIESIYKIKEEGITKLEKLIEKMNNDNKELYSKILNAISVKMSHKTGG